MEKTKILIVEDDPNLLFMERSGLEDLIGGYYVKTATNGQEGLDAFQEFRPDVVLSDIDMPTMNGYDMVSHIREIDTDIIIIYTSALTSPAEISKGFDTGGDNYIKKPFSPQELDAHIKALLKLKSGNRKHTKRGIHTFGNYVLDINNAKLKNVKNNITYTLTPKDTKLLELLVANIGEVVKRESIIRYVWSAEQDFFNSRSLDVFINKLRKMFQNDPTVVIDTIRGIGIRLSVE